MVLHDLKSGLLVELRTALHGSWGCQDGVRITLETLTGPIAFVCLPSASIDAQ